MHNRNIKFLVIIFLQTHYVETTLISRHHFDFESILFVETLAELFKTAAIKFSNVFVHKTLLLFAEKWDCKSSSTITSVKVNIKVQFPGCLRLGLSWFNWWVSFAPEFQCCYFCESSCLFCLSFNSDFYVSKIMHLYVRNLPRKPNN